MEYYKNLSLEDIRFFCELDLDWKIEKWENIKGYEGHYLISNLGRVKSVKFNSFKILKTFVNDNGYIQLRLCVNGSCKSRKVHQLVAESFLGHKVNGFELVVNHKNFNRKDNRHINLEIISTRENTSHRKIKSSSKYAGVTWCKNKLKWLSRIYFDGKRYNLGAFDNEQEASLYYENALNDLKLGNKVIKKPFIKSSKYKGVSFSKNNKKWIASVYYNRKQNYLGWFKSEEDALLAISTFKGTDKAQKVDDVADLLK
jgi:hypothetical protein